MNKLRGALVVLPAEGGDADRLLHSLDSAKTVGLGDFSEVVPLQAADDNRRNVLASAAEEAARDGFDWLLAVTAAESLAPDIIVKMQPALRVYDAVWGGAALATEGGLPPKLERITRLAAQDFSTFFHAALSWWIGPSHFVRPDFARDALRAADMSAPAALRAADMSAPAALRAADTSAPAALRAADMSAPAALRAADTSAPAALRAADTSAWYADYMLALWKDRRAYKTAQCLTWFDGPLPPVAEADRSRLVEYLEAEPVFMTIRHDGRALKLPYTGQNPVIEREQMRGLFFEEEELRFLADRLPRGLRIVDAGANTGNHTLFFAAIMEAETVVPIEPLPRACAAIRAMVAENRLGNVDLSRLGAAIGSSPGRLRPVPSATAGLGATHFVADPEGTVLLRPLDDLVDGPVDLIKIDVEGMEMDALAGAARLIAAQHPHLYVEVVDQKIAEFMRWVDGNSYRVQKLFPDKTHCNYLLTSKEHA